MILKNIIDEDFTNYKTCAMFIGFPSCTFKCEKDCNCTGMCQNAELVKASNIEIASSRIVERYRNNMLSRAIVCGGLEPFDSFDDLLDLIMELRLYTDDPVIIYTGYYKHELTSMLYCLSKYKNIIVKFGRYVPNDAPHYDEILGVNLASNNQYAEVIS